MEKFPHNKTCEVGFTLIEQLMSLTILTILILMILPMTFTRMDDVEEQQFFKILSNDILYVQNMAINHPSLRTRLRFHQTHYEVLTGYIVEKSFRRPIPDGWKISSNYLSEIAFSKTGTIRQAGTITITTSNNKYDLIFPLGKGREYIVKK